MKNVIYYLLMLIVAVSSPSCFRDTAPCDDPSAGDGDSEILLRLRTPGGFSPSATRGLTFAEENKIADVYVLIFDRDARLTAIRKGHDVNSTTTDPLPDGISGTGSFKFTVTPSQTSLNTYNLVVLVNAESILFSTIGADDTSAFIGENYGDVIEAIYAPLTEMMYADGGTIPMWGETGQIKVDASANGKTIKLTRAVARIDVGVGQPTRATTATSDEFTWDGMENDGVTPIPFELQNVFIISPSEQYSVIPAPANLSAGTPTIPAGTGKFDVMISKKLFSYSDPNIIGVSGGRGGWITRTIYVPEADVKMGVAGAPGDGNHTKRMAVVVGGDYGGSGKMTYYRLDFVSGGSLMDVLRNHLYQFNISKVNGPGFPTVEEAYESMSINMQAEILDWNEYSAEIYDDGTNWIKLWVSENSRFFGDAESKEAIVFRNVNSTDRIRFATETPLDAMTLALDNGGTFPDPDNDKLLENDRFRVEVVTGSAGETYFEFTALKPYDASATDNPSILTVTLGRIRFEITVTQRTSESTDWIDGGEIPKDL